jgi:hypothetical protein
LRAKGRASGKSNCRRSCALNKCTTIEASILEPSQVLLKPNVGHGPSSLRVWRSAPTATNPAPDSSGAAFAAKLREPGNHP